MEDFDIAKMEVTLDRLLQRATEPTVPQGAEERLMALIRTTEQRPDTVVFKSQIPVNRWALGWPRPCCLACISAVPALSTTVCLKARPGLPS
jgi:hypothetical protein